MLNVWLALLLASFALQAVTAPAHAQSSSDRYEFHIEESTLGDALDEFVQITGAQLMFSHELAGATDINPVIGTYTTHEALDVLLEGARFSGGLTKGGMIVISLQPDGETSVKNTKLKKGLLASVSAVLFGVSGVVSVQAQDGEVAPPTSAWTDEIIVTAQKREQTADDVGMAISVVGGRSLEQLGIADTADLAQIIPGFTFSDTGFTTPVYTLRGVGFNESSVQATATVGVYHDQIAVPFPIMTSGLEMDNERVEILKGPQGTLYGRNSTGGAVNYIANRPSDEFEISLNAEYGTFETFDFTGVVSGPLTDKLGARVAIRTVHSGKGWQESVSRDDYHGQQNKFAGRLLVDFEPTADFSINIAYRAWTDKSETQVPQFWRPDNQRQTRAVLVGFLDESIYARIPLYGTDNNQLADWTFGNNRLREPVADMTYHSVSGTINWDINDQVAFTSLSSFSKYKNDSSYENSGWRGVPLDASFLGVTARETITPLVRSLYDSFDTLGGVGYTNEAEIDAFSQEVRLDGEAGFLTWLAGAYFSTDSVESNTPQLVEFNTSTNLGHLFGAGLQAVENPTTQDGTSWSVFGHTEWDVLDNLNLTIGLRYTEDKKDYSGCTADTGDGDLAGFTNFFAGSTIYLPGDCVMTFGGMPITTPFVQELDENSVSWRFGLDYDVFDNALVYASYSRGFKSGSFPTLTANLAESLFPVVQEQIDAYEIGVKTAFLDGTFQLNGGLFYYDYKDKQLFTKVITSFGPANSLANVPESRVLGGEFDVRWLPVEGLFVSLGGTYTDTKVQRFEGYNQVGIEGDFSDSRFPLTPKFQATAMVNYDFIVSDTLYGFFNINAAYSTRSYSDYSISEVLDSGMNGSRYPGLLMRYGVTPGGTMDALDVFTLPATIELGARLGLTTTDERWSLSVWGRNLTNEYIVNNSRKSSDAIIAYTGRPRTLGLTLGFKY